MKRIICLVMFLAFNLALKASVVIMTIDENAHGNIDGAPVFPAGFLAQDPGPGGLAGALNYPIATASFSFAPAVAGDVQLFEPGPGGALSDLIRFRPGVLFPSFSPAIVTFYSSNSGGVDSMADIGFPTLLSANHISIIEPGLIGGMQSIPYLPLVGQPGYIDDPTNTGHTLISYVFISEVPEPTAAAFAGLMLSIGLGLRLRRRNGV